MWTISVLEQNVEQSSKGCDGLSQGSDELYQSLEQNVEQSSKGCDGLSQGSDELTFGS